MFLPLGIVVAAEVDRAAEARKRAEPAVRELVRKAGLNYPPAQLFFRAYKEEKRLEIWGANSAKTRLKKIQTYAVLAASGGPGPKLAQGDRQVPEGWYFVDRFNPKSQFHLSLGLNYPNKADLLRTTAVDPGGDIFIHGNQVSIGCLAMGDAAIEEIYTLARAARNKIYVLILPARKSPDRRNSLWSQLFAIDQVFNGDRRLPSVGIDAKGSYRVSRKKAG